VARNKKGRQKPKQLWLVTFSDLMTLLLTFFILLLTMSSMDKSYLTRISKAFVQDFAHLSIKGAGRIPTGIQEVAELMERPQDALLNRDRIKDLLFPDEILPKEIDRSTLDDNLEILQRPEGVALALSDDLLFGSGESRLAEPAKKLLDQIAILLNYMQAPTNVAGYSDSIPSTDPDNFALSGMRAMSVLEYFIMQHEMDSRLFSVSGYGPHFPLAANDSAQGRAKNRRVEILVKTTPLRGGYL
jgi:chemotaxis protein MotB